MKVYISADIEGIGGIAHWDEALPDKPDYQAYREFMNRTVVAACEGAVDAGASEVLVKDAHAHGRNIDPSRLPECARVIRGWSGHPLMMVQDLDATFDALAMVGYHSPAASGANPLAHTMSSSRIALLTVNGELASEFHLHAWAGAMVGVPTVFVSGDEELCADVVALGEDIHTCSVQHGEGNSSTGLHPAVAEARIRRGMHEALSADPRSRVLELPPVFHLEIEYHKPSLAYSQSFYPGAYLQDARTVAFDTEDYFEVLRALKFLM